VGCPYEGEVDPTAVAQVAAELYGMGCYEISLGETIGTATPLKIKHMLEAVSNKIPVSHLAAHYHDTYGMAVANIFASLQMGVAVVDASVGGLGGCPYAPGAAGNVATEQVVYLLDGMGITHGIDREKLKQAGETMLSHLDRHPRCNL
jgi:hydroxymethylglutaryl-CoA lyase